MGFRRFSAARTGESETEWALVCAAYNLKRLHRLAGLKLAGAG